MQINFSSHLKDLIYSVLHVIPSNTLVGCNHDPSSITITVVVVTVVRHLKWLLESIYAVKVFKRSPSVSKRFYISIFPSIRDKPQFHYIINKLWRHLILEEFQQKSNIRIPWSSIYVGRIQWSYNFLIGILAILFEFHENSMVI